MVPVSRPRHPYPLRRYVPLLLCLSLISLFGGQAHATVKTQAQSIDNYQGDFADGSFYRVSLSPYKSSLTAASTEIADQAGIVQLAPAGVLNKWTASSSSLPSADAVADAGVTAVGKHIYIIGGDPLSGGDSTNKVYWATVNPQAGTLVDTGSGPWNATTMPSIQAVTDTTAATDFSACMVATAYRTRAGVASLVTGTNSGYIYMVGGAIEHGSCNNPSLSSPRVQRATVASDGSITGWTTLANLPSPPNPDDGSTVYSGNFFGVEGASVVIAETQESDGTSRHFLYVIGGKSVYPTPSAYNEYATRVLKSVYYTEIDSSTGGLKNPTNGSTSLVWKRATNINFVSSSQSGITLASSEGLWNATATSANVTVGEDLKSAIFLAGGSHDPGTGSSVRFNSYVYRANIGTDGALTWASGTTNTVGSDQVGLAGRRGMVGLTYNNKLYFVGGRTTNASGTARDTVATAFFDDNFDMIKLDETGDDFFVGDSTADEVLDTSADDDGRYNHGIALVRAEAPDTEDANTSLNSAWAFVIGGSNEAGNPRNTLYIGKIGGDEADDTYRAPDGWYYSGVIKTSYALGSGSSTSNKEARLIAFYWSADINRASNTGADIELQFRKTNTATGECAGESDFSSTDTWSNIADGYANNSLYTKTATSGSMYNTVNTATLFGSNAIADCLQYRAHLRQNTSGSAAVDSTASPRLLSVYIEKTIAGNSDINIPSGGLAATVANNKLSTLTMTIQNLSTEGLSQTLSVNDTRAANGDSAEGSFFVNLCIARSNLTAATPSLTLPSPSSSFTSSKTGGVANTTICPYYAEIYSGEMGKGSTLDLTARNVPSAYGGGARWYSNATGKAISNIRSVFSTTGNYRIGLVLDSVDNVPEGDDGGEDNNRGETTSATNGTTVTFSISEIEVITDTYTIMLPIIAR
ncbi:MAG: hypothetical protein HGA19_00725 [Oscillochloris sp.]|nr:hypothetical protein [Oscillochloris sp.]